MATQSSNLLLTLLALGESSYGAFPDWGAVMVDNLNNIEGAVSNSLSIPILDTNTTLTDAQARNLVITATGTLTVARALIFPLRKRMYYVTNSTTGGFGISIRASTGALVALQPGQSMLVYCDGTDFISISGWSYSSGSDGVALRHPSGVQICIHRRTGGNTLNGPIGTGGIGWSAPLTWTYPQSFKTGTVPFFSATVEMHYNPLAPGSFKGMRWIAGNDVDNASALYYKLGTSQDSYSSDHTNLFAIGMWR
jgi:hypothetical protein